LVPSMTQQQQHRSHPSLQLRGAVAGCVVMSVTAAAAGSHGTDPQWASFLEILGAGLVGTVCAVLAVRHWQR
jgi:predicted membrane protein